MSVSDIIYSVSESGSVSGNHSASKYSAMVNKTLPECKYFDYIRAKSKLLGAFSKWRFETTLRRKKQERFQTFVQDPQFDVSLRIQSIKDAKDRVQIQNTFRKLKTERNIAREGDCFKATMRHKILCKSFGYWQSQYTKLLNRRTQIEIGKISVSKNERVTDIMRQLHDAISEQAELQIAVENKEKELNDANTLLFDTQKRIKAAEDSILGAQNENKRIKGLLTTIDNEYKDKIAGLKMRIIQTQENAARRLKEAKYNLQQRQQASNATNESLIVSKGDIEQRVSEIMERLEKTQIVVMSLRDDLIKQQMIQQNEEDEYNQITDEINQLTQDCNRLEEVTNNLDNTAFSSISELKQTYGKAQDSKKVIDEKISENQQIMAEQNMEIAKLSRQLEFLKQHAINTEYAFAEEEEDY